MLLFLENLEDTEKVEEKITLPIQENHINI